MTTHTPPADAEKLRAKPVITPAEIERRRHVQDAIANSRLAGLPPPCGIEKEILDAYVRGEIEGKDLVEVFKKRLAKKLN